MTGRKALAALGFVLLATAASAQTLETPSQSAAIRTAFWAALAAEQTGGGVITGGTRFLGGTVTNPILFPDGTSPLPAIAFASQPTLGFWRSASSVITQNGSLVLTGSFTSAVDVLLGATGFMHWLNKGGLDASFNGIFRAQLENGTIGSVIKVDALPTVASGFGTSPSITAGSTAFAGSVNVGTGGVATSGIINFNGTAFPSAPFCTLTPTLTNAVTRPTTVTTTQLTLTTTTAWTASDVVFWQCISSK